MQTPNECQMYDVMCVTACEVSVPTAVVLPQELWKRLTSSLYRLFCLSSPPRPVDGGVFKMDAIVCV